MKVKRHVLSQAKLLQNTVIFDGNPRAVLVLTTDGYTGRSNAVYSGPKSGAGWVAANRIKRQGIPLQVLDDSPPF